MSNRKQGQTGESLGKSAKKSKVEIDKVKQQKGQKEKMTVKKRKGNKKHKTYPFLLYFIFKNIERLVVHNA